MCLSSHDKVCPETAATACHAVAAVAVAAAPPSLINDSVGQGRGRTMLSVDDFIDCDWTWASFATPHHCLCDDREYPRTSCNIASTKEHFLASAGVDGKVKAMDQLHVRVDRLKISVDDFIEDDTTTTCSMTSADAQWAEQPVEVNPVRPVSSQERQIEQPSSGDQCRAVAVSTLNEPIASQHTTAIACASATNKERRDQKVSVDDFIDCETTAGEPLWEYACIGWEESYWTVNVRCRKDVKEPDARNQKETIDEMGDGIPCVIYIRARASLDGYKTFDPLCRAVDHSTTVVVGEHVISMIQTNDYFIDEDHPEYYDQTLIAV